MTTIRFFRQQDSKHGRSPPAAMSGLHIGHLCATIPPSLRVGEKVIFRVAPGSNFRRRALCGVVPQKSGRNSKFAGTENILPQQVRFRLTSLAKGRRFVSRIDANFRLYPDDQ